MQTERSGMEIDAAAPAVMALPENGYENPERKTWQELRYLTECRGGEWLTGRKMQKRRAG